MEAKSWNFYTDRTDKVIDQGFSPLETVFLCSPKTLYVGHAGFELIDLPASSSQVLGLNVRRAKSRHYKSTLLEP